MPFLPCAQFLLKKRKKEKIYVHGFKRKSMDVVMQTNQLS
jgi:hypothetical protein